ncbi:Enhancer of polycomb-like protein 1 [Ceratobasidium sp. 394]|nr:Enhancer of polycomb-like protein 1 [Ceratobasidium sp. 394]
MDEADAEWLAKNNVELAGATRSSPPPSARGPPRSAKARGKEPEAASVAITADEFELVMGILERLTDERYPCLHADVSVFPAITEFEPTFANRLPTSFFPNYRVPDWIPQPPQLLRMLRVIYPHWRERRLEREGRRIIPQINSDETNEGDPYVCFRRRDAKPVRKTRRTDTGSIDRMQSLQNNVRQLQHIVQHVLRREQLKQARALEERQVMNCRMQLSEVKRKFPTTPFGMRDDDEVLVDKIVKRPRPEGAKYVSGHSPSHNTHLFRAAFFAFLDVPKTLLPLPPQMLAPLDPPKCPTRAPWLWQTGKRSTSLCSATHSKSVGGTTLSIPPTCPSRRPHHPSASFGGYAFVSAVVGDVMWTDAPFRLRMAGRGTRSVGWRVCSFRCNGRVANPPLPTERAVRLEAQSF